MISTLLKGGILGGLVAFIWSALTWMVFPWNGAQLHNFTNEAAVVETLRANVTESGIYTIPGTQRPEGLTEEQIEAHDSLTMQKMTTGPFMYAAVRLEGSTGMAASMIMGFVGMVIAAMLITWLLLKTTGVSYMGQAVMAGVIALIGGLIYQLPMTAWWQFPMSNTVLTIVDNLIGWFLAGLVIARFTRPRAT